MKKSIKLSASVLPGAATPGSGNQTSTGLADPVNIVDSVKTGKHEKSAAVKSKNLLNSVSPAIATADAEGIAEPGTVHPPNSEM